MKNPSEQILAKLKQIPGSDSLEIPPKIFLEMQGQFLSYVENASMKNSFPIFEKYEGPMGNTQGGIITAAFDNTYGPFSYLVAQGPCVTIDITTSFIRPISMNDEELIVEVFLTAKTKSLLFMDGKAYNKTGKLVATSTTRMMIVKIP